MEKEYIKILHDTSHKNPMWACKMIPVLIYWASVDKKPHYYSELSKEAGHKTAGIRRDHAFRQGI